MKSALSKKPLSLSLLSLLKLFAAFACVTFLSACELLPNLTKQDEQSQLKSEQDSKTVTTLCVSTEQREQFKKWCSIDYFFEYAINTSLLNWPERKAKIEQLGEESDMLIEKAMLSQGTITPYRDRLRAQNWLIKASVNASEAMNKLLNMLIFENSKQLLEFESAITILSRVNARQEKTISELQLQLDKKEEQLQIQQDQVEQLLKIESDLIEQNRNDKR